MRSKPPYLSLIVPTLLAAISITTAKAGQAPLSLTKYFENVKASAPFLNEWKAPQKLTIKSSKDKGNRSLASDSVAVPDESMMSAELKSFRDTLLATTTPEQIDALLAKADSEYDKYPADLKFVAAQFIPLRSMRGFLWRVLPLVEHNTMLHSMLLSFVKTGAGQIKIYYPTDQWKAGFDYLSQPFAVNGKLAKQVSNESDLQGFLAGPLYQALRLCADRLAAIDLSQRNIAWDNKIFYGPASYVDNVDRYRLVGDVERLMTLAQLHAFMAQLTFQRAYALQGAIDLYAKIGRLYGFDGIFTGNVEGAPASQRTEVVRRSQFANLGTLFSDGSQFTAISLMHLKNATEASSQAWDAMQRRPSSESYVINSGPFLANERVHKIRIANLKAMMSGPAQIRSAATGEIAEVDLPAFYNNPPQDLKTLLATEFEDGEQWHTQQVDLGEGKTQSVKYRNYYVGRPSGWNTQQLHLYFPKVATNDDVAKTARILDEAYGGFEGALPLAYIVR